MSGGVLSELDELIASAESEADYCSESGSNEAMKRLVVLREARDTVAKLLDAAEGGYDTRGETGIERVFDKQDRLALIAALARANGSDGRKG